MASKDKKNEYSKIHKAKKSKNYALLIVLLVFILVFYFVAMIKVGNIIN